MGRRVGGQKRKDSSGDLLYLFASSFLSPPATTTLISSPYRGSTTYNSNTVYFLGGLDQGFSYQLAPGKGISILEVVTSFNFRAYLRHGGDFPGKVLITEFEDNAVLSDARYVNNGVADVAVYFIIDSYESRGRGDYEFAWHEFTIDGVSKILPQLSCKLVS
jgi:hypothetical protein